jgi:hypothetical protein
MACEKTLEIVPSAGHVLKEPGALARVGAAGAGVVRDAHLRAKAGA